jgi:hypothetical protein
MQRDRAAVDAAVAAVAAALKAAAQPVRAAKVRVRAAKVRAVKTDHYAPVICGAVIALPVNKPQSS